MCDTVTLARLKSILSRVQALGELQRPAEAVACLDTMHSAGLSANAITYTAVLSACQAQPALVVTLLERMQRERVVPNTIMLTAAINVLSRGDEACRGEIVRVTGLLLLRLHITTVCRPTIRRLTVPDTS
jgi:hypothetical protein